jgi:hypothetical protein
MKVLAAGDLRSFSELLYEAEKESFPSTANEVALDVALRPNALSPAERAIAQAPEFRMEAARYLALGSRSQALKVNKDALRTLSRKFVGGSRALEAKSLLTLAHLQDRRDIPAIASVAKSEDPNRYRIAVHALRLMCLDDAQVALDEVAQKSTSSQKQQFILDSRNALAICKHSR